jgi:hypothetical protein
MQDEGRNCGVFMDGYANKMSLLEYLTLNYMHIYPLVPNAP